MFLLLLLPYYKLVERGSARLGRITNNENIHKFDALHCTMYLQQRFLAEVTEDSNETEETKIVKERNEG